MTTYHQATAGAQTSGPNNLSGFPGSVSFGRGSDQPPQYAWNSRAHVQSSVGRAHEPQPPPPLPKYQEHSSRNLLVYIPPPPPPPPSNYRDLGVRKSHSDISSSSAATSIQQPGLSSSLKRSHSDISSSAIESRAQQPKDSKLPSSDKDATVTRSRRSDAPSSALESKAQPSRKSNSTKKLKWEPPPTKKPPPSSLDASIDAINSLAGLQGRWQAANKVKLQSKKARSRTRPKRQQPKGQQSLDDEVQILAPNESKSSEQVWIDVDHGEVANPQFPKEVIDLTDDKEFPPLDVKPPTKYADILSNSVSSGQLEDMATSQLSSYASALENALDHTTAHANSSDGEEMEISSDEDEVKEDSSSRAENEEDLLDTLYTDLQTPPRLSLLRSQVDEGSVSDSQNGNTRNENAGAFFATGADANAATNLADRCESMAAPVADEPIEDDAVSNERKKHALRIAGRCSTSFVTLHAVLLSDFRSLGALLFRAQG